MRPFTVPLVCLAMGAALALGSGCAIDAGSGNLKRQTRAIDPVNALEVSSGFEVAVKTGKAREATVETDDNLIDDVVLESVGNRLILKWKDPLKTYEPSGGVRVELVLPELVEVRASGEAQVSIDAIVSESVTLEASGGSRIVTSELIANDVLLSLRDDSRAELGLVNVNNLSCDASGASHVEASGTGSQLSLELRGASQAELSGVSSAEILLEAEGASRARVAASERLEVDAKEASDVRYRGVPKDLKIQESQDSTVKPAS